MRLMQIWVSGGMLFSLSFPPSLSLFARGIDFAAAARNVVLTIGGQKSRKIVPAAGRKHYRGSL